jgi:hypothetical protein
VAGKKRKGAKTQSQAFFVFFCAFAPWRLCVFLVTVFPFWAIPHYSPSSGRRTQCTAPVGVFSIRSFDVPPVRLHSLILRERRHPRSLAPFASKSDE